MDDVVADGEIAEVGEERRHLRFLALRTTERNFGLVEQIAGAEENKVRVGQRNTLGHVRLDDDGGRNVIGEIRGLVDEDFHAGLGRTATNAKRQVVLVKDVGQPFDLAGARHRKHDTLTFAGQLADLLGHGGDRAVKTHGGLGLQDDVLAVIGTFDAELLNGENRRLLQRLRPLLWTEIQFFRPHQIANQAAVMRVGELRPPGVVRFVECVRFVEYDRRTGNQVEKGLLSSGDGCVKLPSGKHAHARVAHGFLNRFVVTREAMATEPRIDGRERVFVHGCFGERQQNSIIGRCRRALRRGVELSKRLDFVAKHFDAHGPVRFGWIDVDQSAAMRELTRHLDHVHLVVSGEAEVLNQSLGVDHLAAANDLGEAGVERCVAQTHAGRGKRRDHDVGRTSSDLPQRRRPGFLNFRVGRLVFERQHVVSRQADDRLGRDCAGQFGDRAKQRQQLIHRAIVADHDHQRARGGTLQQ